MREASYSYVLYLVSIGEDIAYLQTPSKTTWGVYSGITQEQKSRHIKIPIPGIVPSLVSNSILGSILLSLWPQVYRAIALLFGSLWDRIVALLKGGKANAPRTRGVTTPLFTGSESRLGIAKGKKSNSESGSQPRIITPL